MFRTRWIRKMFDSSCTLGQRRPRIAKTSKPVRLALESLEERVTPDATTLVPGDVHLNFFGHGHSPEFTIPVTVRDLNTGGAADSGTVTCNLVSGNTQITLGSGTVNSHGVCNVHVDLGKLPDNLSIGSYHLEEHFTGNSHYFDCDGSGSLDVDDVPTTVVAPNVNVTFNNTNTFNITVNVNSTNGPATSGTVNLDLVVGNKTIQLGTATVGANGVATLTVTDHSILNELDSLKPGDYVLDVNYEGSNPFAGSSCSATLTVNPAPTTIVVPPTVNITENITTNYNITINLSSPNAPTPSGTVTLDLVNGNQTISLGTATVGPNGTVTVNIPSNILSSLPPGQYQLVVNFNAAPGTPNGNGTTTSLLNLLPQTQPNATTGTGGPTSFGPGTGTGAPSTPSAPPLNPLLAAIELALDSAMLGNMTNPGSVGELEMFAQVFLGHSIPTAIPQLLSDIQSLLPQTGTLFGPALQFAGYLDIDLPIENPM